MRVERDQVLAYRVFVQGLHRDVEQAGELAVLDVGVQDTPPGSATQAMATRLTSAAGDPASSAGLATTWSLRGAPHVHRSDDLVALSRALWPWSDADALARLDTSSSPVRASGMPARKALRFVAGQIADIVTHPMPKGEVSAALTPRVPAAMTVDCRVCKATHIVETLFRSAVLPAGITFDPGQRVVTFMPAPDWPGVPEGTERADRIITSYLRLLGPAAPDDVAAFLGTRSADLKTQWPEGLAEVEVAGSPRWIPQEALDLLRSPPDPPALRLLPPSDPLLQGRDRNLLVPDRDHQKALWPTLGRPGAVLVRGNIDGIWRARKKGRRLDVAVEPFRRLDAGVRRSVAQEAERVAEARGLASSSVAFP